MRNDIEFSRLKSTKYHFIIKKKLDNLLRICYGHHMVLAATSNPEIEIYYEKFVKSKFHKKIVKSKIYLLRSHRCSHGRLRGAIIRTRGSLRGTIISSRVSSGCHHRMP